MRSLSFMATPPFICFYSQGPKDSPAAICFEGWPDKLNLKLVLFPAMNATILPSWTKPGAWTLGRDPLGLQATSIRLYRGLAPGMTNVTNRLRYFTFYCWVTDRYEREAHSSDVEKWKLFIRRAEAAYALACHVVDAKSSDGMGGANWANLWAKQIGAEPFDLTPHTDKPGKDGQYLKATFGNLGQFYRTSMTDAGFLTPSSSIPLVSKDIGRAAAKAFHDAVGDTVEALAEAIDTGFLARDAIDLIGKEAHPSKISQETEELQLLRRYVRGEHDQDKTGQLRRSSAWLALDLIRKGVPQGDYDAFRRALYNRKLPSGETYRHESETIDRWRAYQANEFCHIVLECLLNGLLAAQLEQHPDGIEPDQLIADFLESQLASSDLAEDWHSFAVAKSADHTGDEEALVMSVLEALSEDEAAPSNDAVTSSVSLLATLWARWRSGDGNVRELIAKFAGAHGRSLAGVIATLDSEMSKPTADALKAVLLRHVISDHLAIAGRKLASSGTFTYHFTVSDGKLTGGRLGKYAYTTPRLHNIVRFMRDGHFLDASGPTPDGIGFLDVHQPV